MKLTAPRILVAIGCMAFVMYSGTNDFYGPWAAYLMISIMSFLSAAMIVVIRAMRKRPPDSP